MSETAAAPATPTETEATAPVTTTTATADGAPEPKVETTTETAKPTVPEKYDLKLPDGSPLDPSRVEKIATLAKERGLSNEAAQELLNGEHEVLDTYVKTQNDALAQKDQAWVETLKSDPDFGRDKFAENVEAAKRFLQKFGDAELLEQLDKSRLGNFPPLVKAFSRAGRLMASDALVLADGSAANKKPIEDRIYGPGETK